jgi:hypothetical protein
MLDEVKGESRRINKYVGSAAAARCQKNVASLSTKVRAAVAAEEEDELAERFDECVSEQRAKGESRSRARRICQEAMMEEFEASVGLSKAKEERRRFLSTAQFAASPGVFTIFQR